jgi:L-amino acid N-acyltransferase YncA
MEVADERHYSGGMEIRDARIEDWPRIWPFFREIVRAGDTFAYDQRMEEPGARAIWMVGPPARATVAVDGEDVLGTANMYANRPGPGSHVASASYMVNSAHRGKGAGRALVEDSLEWARRAGFKAMQFNAVTETNASAVALYRSLGFEVIGTVPEAFLHPTDGYVGLHVMHRRL